VNLTGNSYANTIVGSAHDDVLGGAGGDDDLSGGDGRDLLAGGSGNDILSGDSGADTLDGGAGADLMQGGAGDDAYLVDSAADAVIEAAGSGTDTVYTSTSFALGANIENLRAVSGALGLALTGNAFANTILGTAGNDVIRGGAGNDKLFGGFGRDTFYGSKGRDIFVLDSKLDRKKNVDKIVDFVVKDDSFYLDNFIFKKLGKGTASKPGKLNKAFFTIGPKAKDKNDYLIYNDKKGVLYYDADGSRKGTAIEIATLKKKLKMTEKDFFII
jgi:Ca2+-binding RTX toxin-like protein